MESQSKIILIISDWRYFNSKTRLPLFGSSIRAPARLFHPVWKRLIEALWKEHSNITSKDYIYDTLTNVRTTNIRKKNIRSNKWSKTNLGSDKPWNQQMLEATNIGINKPRKRQTLETTNIGSDKYWSDIGILEATNIQKRQKNLTYGVTN